MDVKLLEAFRAVMENRSVTQAAVILGVTQPAVSAQLARLESLVGFSLFDREGGRLRPSGEGYAFYDEVRQTLGMIDRLQVVAERIRSGETGTLVVASHPSASISLLPSVVSEFSAAHPDVAVRMINRTSEEVVSVFEASAVDLGVAELSVDVPGVSKRRYAIDCLAILPAGHPLAERETIRLADLSGLPFVSMTPSRAIGHRIKSALLESGAEVRKAAEAEYFSTICGLVSCGMGISIVDYWSAQTFRHLGIEQRRIDPPIHYEVSVFHSRERGLSRLGQRLRDGIEAKLRTHGWPVRED